MLFTTPFAAYKAYYAISLPMPLTLLLMLLSPVIRCCFIYAAAATMPYAITFSPSVFTCCCRYITLVGGDDIARLLALGWRCARARGAGFDADAIVFQRRTERRYH